MSKTVVITGVTGQAGSYFAEYLLDKYPDYEIYGMARRLSVKNHQNIKELYNNPRFHLFSGDLNDEHSLENAVKNYQPDYFINAGAQSFVAESWVTPSNTFRIDAGALIPILEAIRKFTPECRFINFGSSEEMGDVIYSPQDEKHPPRARSIYGAAKVAARQIVKVYRESYKLYCLQSWNYNYESKRRGEEFVTRKITKGVARIAHAIPKGLSFEPILLGDLSSKRDWSHCLDIIDGMWRMINQEQYTSSKKLTEYIFASGEVHSVREFVQKAFQAAFLYGNWVGSGLDEKFVDDYGRVLVKVDPQFFRPADVLLLHGNNTRAKAELHWTPKISFDDLITEMVVNDLNISKCH